jgi:putative sigma-54 modulation protein
LQVTVKGKNIEVTEALRTHVEQKVAKIAKLGLDFKEIEVKLVVEKNPSIKDNQMAELTLVGSGPLLRATDRDRDLYIAVDKAVSKLLRRIKKFHEKQIDRTQAQESALRGPSPEESAEEESPSIVKRKTIFMKPMMPEEAVLQMEMLGHDFFVFTDSETGQATVVYKRNDGNIGLIDTSG